VFGVAALVTLGCALRLASLGVHSLWFDELASLYLANSPDLVEALSGDRNPPLFYWLLRHWMGVAGTSEAALRALPALASCASLVVFAIVCVRACAAPLALLATALLALSPFSLWFAQELRGYSLLELSGTLALAAVAAALHDARRARLAFALATAAVALGVGSHYLAGVLVPALFAVAAWAWSRRAASTRDALALVLGALAGFAAWGPWLVAMLPRQTATSWAALGQLGWSDLAQFPARLFLVESARLPESLRWLVWSSGGVVLAGLAIAVWLAARARTSVATLAPVLALAGIAAALAIALASKPNFLPRYLASCAPALLLAVASGLCAIPRRAVGWGAALLLVASALVHVGVARSRNWKQDYRAAYAEVVARWRPGDAVLSVTGTYPGFDEAPARHYLREHGAEIASLVPAARLDWLLGDPSAPRRVHVVIYDAPYTRDVDESLRAAGSIAFESHSSMDVRYVLYELRR
jgi:4-amino-4-deoxy-L-arabinose transferase-like glycosyltransferase